MALLLWQLRVAGIYVVTHFVVEAKEQTSTQSNQGDCAYQRLSVCMQNSGAKDLRLAPCKRSEGCKVLAAGPFTRAAF